jgi:nucleotide-binding universal stress UspA family protein
MGPSPDWTDHCPGASYSQGKEREDAVETIICGIDRSPAARSALRVATELAEALRLRVVAVHVADSFGEDHNPNAPAILRARGNAERLLANVLYDEQLVGRVDWRAEVGDIAERLAAVAADERAVLILLGARSKGKARPVLRGRLAGEIVRKSSIPVIIVPPQGAPPVAPLPSVRTGQVGSRTHQGAGPHPQWQEPCTGDRSACSGQGSRTIHRPRPPTRGQHNVERR